MPTNIDCNIRQFEDKIFTIQISPPTDISTWSFAWTVRHRQHGVSGMIVKSSASGFGGGQSGITITNSGNGSLNVQINSVDTSGMDPNISYAVDLVRTNSGSVAVISTGYMELLSTAYL